MPLFAKIVKLFQRNNTGTADARHGQTSWPSRFSDAGENP
jgi:hypothetical protein